MLLAEEDLFCVLQKGCFGLSWKKTLGETPASEGLHRIDVYESENEASSALRALSWKQRGAVEKAGGCIKRLPQYSKKSISSCYQLGEIIGVGGETRLLAGVASTISCVFFKGFSVVRHVTRKGTDQQFACKIMKLPKKRDEYSLDCMSRKSMFNEIEVSSRLYSPRIAQVEEFFVTKSKVYVIMDLMRGGVLLDHMASQKHQRYSEEDAKIIFHQILKGVSYLHARNIAHRDLKLQNLMLVRKNDLSHIKIIDMGLAKQISCGTNTSCGSPLFVAPEILSRSSDGHGLAVDMWSAGVILFFLLGGYTPFFDENEYQLFANIESCTYDFNEPVWTDISPSAKDLIAQCLQLNPGRRMTVTQALSHQWFQTLLQEKNT